MNQQDIFELIKSIIRAKAKDESINLVHFFEDNRNSILELVILIQPSIGEIDRATLEGYYEAAVKEYKSVFPIDIDPSTSLIREGLNIWLTDERKDEISDDYINRYFTYLKNEGRSDKIIDELSRSSESILGKLADPESPTSVYRRGLVVGSVQSGKTGNFNAVINRAIDAGYNLIIILSGIMEDLRRQTQIRLEYDVIGEGMINTQTEQPGSVGVGKVRRFGTMGDTEVAQVFSITSPKADFGKTLQDANFSLNHKNLLVCKKNTGVLKNLLIWLSDYLSENSEQHNIPLLIIDDEADNASLNNFGHKGREYASTINGHIRAILNLFSKKSYLGYTATPFANVLQDRNEVATGNWTIRYKKNGEHVTRDFLQVDHIFPDDFIELLEPPSNYIGSKQIFNTISSTDVKIPLIETIADHLQYFPIKIFVGEESDRAATQQEISIGDSLRSPRKDDVFPKELPISLIDALSCFVLSIAVRLKRRPGMVGTKLYNPHSTMLIHVSRFTDWQIRTRDLVQKEVVSLTERIVTELPSSKDSIYAELEFVWNKYYAAIIENIRSYLPEGYSDEFLNPILFEEIMPLLPEAVKGLETKAINSVTKEKLIYATDSNGNGKKYIAIGGNRLSRGFTLEGLTINYFIRNTNYADTLLQMGRWFGYRPGYIDCCKLFTSWDSIEKFDAATRTIEELESDFKKMHRAGKTPKDFVLRVKKHPGVLKITRPSILKNTDEVNWSYEDKLVQTTQFAIDGKGLSESWTDILELISKNKSYFKNDKEGYYYFDTDIYGFFDFLNCRNSFYDFKTEIEQIKAFVNICQEKGKLQKWRIAIKSRGSSKKELAADQTNLPGHVKLSVRSGPKKSQNHYTRLLDGVFYGSGKSANIVSVGLDMALWLDDSEKKSAELEFRNLKISEFKGKGLTDEEAVKKFNKTSIPEKVYREKTNEDNGLLVIYLMDVNEIFKESTPELLEMITRKEINLDIPLVGYAIGFPPIEAEIGGVYVKGKYNIDEDEPEVDEYDEETLDSINENI